MTHLFSLVSYFSENWKQQYGKILHAGHLNTIMKNMERYLLGEQLFSEPYFKDEIKENVNGIFESFVHILQNNKINDEERAFLTEKIPFQNWLMVLGSWDKDLPQQAFATKTAYLLLPKFLLKAAKNLTTQKSPNHKERGKSILAEQPMIFGEKLEETIRISRKK